MTPSALTAFAADVGGLADRPQAIGAGLGAPLAQDGWPAAEPRRARPRRSPARDPRTPRGAARAGRLAGAGAPPARSRELPPAPLARIGRPAGVDRGARVAARPADGDPRPRVVVRRRRLRGPRAR